MKTKKLIEIKFFPTKLLMFAVFNIAITVCTVRIILTKGANFDGWGVNIISNFIAGSGKIIYLYFGFSLFLVFVVITLIIVFKCKNHVSEAAARWTPDSIQAKMMAIETEYSCGSITEEQAQTGKTDIQDESDFMLALDGIIKLISGNVKISIFSILVIIIGRSTIDYLLCSVALVDAVKTYIRLSIGSGIVLLFPISLVSLTVWMIPTKFANTKIKDDEKQ
jgi:flagellar biosynthesis protein FlhA